MNLSDLSSLDAAFYVIRFCFNSLVSILGNNFTTIIYASIIFASFTAIFAVGGAAIRAAK